MGVIGCVVCGALLVQNCVGDVLVVASLLVVFDVFDRTLVGLKVNVSGGPSGASMWIGVS